MAQKRYQGYPGYQPPYQQPGYSPYPKQPQAPQVPQAPGYQPPSATVTPGGGQYYELDARLNRLEREVDEIIRRINRLNRRVRRIEDYLNIRDE